MKAGMFANRKEKEKTNEELSEVHQVIADLST
jgi:hypothetical protein